MALTLTLRFETKGRKGREVTTVSGLAPLGDVKIAALASDLKRRCASGGTVDDGGTILLQGDHRDAVQKELESRGWTVRVSGSARGTR